MSLAYEHFVELLVLGQPTQLQRVRQIGGVEGVDHSMGDLDLSWIAVKELNLSYHKLYTM